MSWTITPSQALPDDADAVAYIAAVEAADGEALEPAVRLAINNFVKGCKSDGIWPAIKASCILAGARTLNGALVPLVGTAPTNNGPFVVGDYNRKTGLVGDGSTKYLDSNSYITAAGTSNMHQSAYLSSAGSTEGGVELGADQESGGNFIHRYLLYKNFAAGELRSFFGDTTLSTVTSQASSTGFKGQTRSLSASYTIRSGGSSTTRSTAAAAGAAIPTTAVFARKVSNGTTGSYSNARLAFYSIGESLDLALLDARVTALVNALAAAIP